MQSTSTPESQVSADALLKQVWALIDEKKAFLGPQRSYLGDARG